MNLKTISKIGLVWCIVWVFISLFRKELYPMIANIVSGTIFTIVWHYTKK